MNAAPGIRMHTHPTEGTPRNVGAPILDMLYPPGEDATIPVIAVTGTNGKTTTTRLIAHIFRHTGKTVGLTTTDGIYINNRVVMEGDMTGPFSANVILSNPTIDVAVLETARGGILRARTRLRRVRRRRRAQRLGRPPRHARHQHRRAAGRREVA